MKRFLSMCARNWALLTLIPFSYLLIRGYAETQGISILLRISSLLIMFIISSILFYRDIASPYKQKGSLELGLFLMVIIIAIRQIAGTDTSLFYPAFYITLTFIIYVFGLKITLVTIGYFILVENTAIILGDTGWDWSFFLPNHGLLIVFTSIIGILFSLEKTGRSSLQDALDDIEKETEEFDRFTSVTLEEPDLGIISSEGKKKRIMGVISRTDDKIERILGFLYTFCRPFSVVLLLIDHNEGVLRVKGCVSVRRGELSFVPIHIENSVFNWPFKNREKLYLPDLKRPDLLGYYKREMKLRSFLCMPLVKEDFIKGFICMDSNDIDAFSTREEDLARIAAWFITDLFDNTALLHRVHQDGQITASFHVVGQRLNSTLDINEICSFVINTLKDIIDFDLAAVATSEDKDGSYMIRASKGVSYRDRIEASHPVLKGGIAGWIISHKQPYIVSDASEQKENIFTEKVVIPNIKSLMGFPMTVGDECLGTLIIGGAKRGGYSSFESKNINTLTSQVALALSNARLYKEKEQMSISDGLTGLYNHRYFQEAIDREIKRAERYPQKISVLMMDLDLFKKVNDTHGHLIGDRVLKDVATVLMKSSRKVDVVSRYGGEEFAEILPNTDEEGARTMAERIRNDVEIWFKDNPIEIEGPSPHHLTISIGYATYPKYGRTKEEILNHADMALYRAKEYGRNRAVSFSEL